MVRHYGSVRCVLMLIVTMGVVETSVADDAFDKLLSAGKYKEAIDYAEEKIGPAQRDSDVWLKLAQANDALGLTEKALACYLVSWRMNPNDYKSLLGAAKVYNKLSQPDNAINMAKKALDLNFTAEASWEYARACIALNRSAEAKKALEKVIESDSSNVIANRELGNIYYAEKSYIKAIPLLKRSYRENGDGEVAYRIGKAYVESSIPDSALTYLKIAVSKKARVSEAALDLARAYYGQKNYKSALTEYGRVSSSDLDGNDHYRIAVSREKTNDERGAASAYEIAVSKMSDSRSQDALLAREKVGRSYLARKDFGGALRMFEQIADADDRAKTVPDIYFLLSEAHEGQGNTQRAISMLEKAISLNSRNVEAYARLGELYQKNGMPDKANATYQTMMSLSPNDPQVYLSLGRYSLKSKKYSEALGHFEKSDNLKHTASAAEGIAISSFNLNRLDKARDAAKAAVSLDPSATWEARLILAKVLMKDQNYRAAQEHLEFIVNKEPSNTEYLEQLATCYDQNNLKEKLAEIDRKIINLNAKNVDSRLRLARFADGKNDVETALKLYRELADLTPKSAEVYRRLYELSMKKGNKSEVVAFMKKYLELTPGDAEGQRDLGDILYEMKDYDGALAAYRAALKINPGIKGFYKKYAEIVIAKGQQDEVITALYGVVKTGEADFGTYTTLGMIYQKKKNYSKAVEMYQKALQLEPQNMDGLTALASCQAASGDVAGAIISYEQAIMMNPKATTEYKDLGDLYTRQHNPDEAMKAYKNYVDRVPSDESVAIRVGKYYYERKKYDEAGKYLGKAQGKEAAEADVQAILGESYFRSGKYKEAIVVLESLRSRLKPKSPALRDILGMLAQSYEKDGKDVDAARVYGEYVAIPGVRDSDAAYKNAFLQEKSNSAAAMRIYEENTKSYPADYRSFLRLGLMYADKKETLQKSIPMLRRTTELADSIPVVWLELGKIYGKLGKEDDELQAYRRYVQADPQNLDANKRIGMIMVRRGQISEGLVYLEMANTLSPNDPVIMASLAKGYVKTGRQNEAVDLLNRAKNARKDDPDIRFQLFELYQKTGQTGKASEEIKQLVEMKRDNRYLLLYAEAMLIQGKNKEAENAVEDVLATEAENVDALMLKAKVLRAKKKYDEAVEVYKEISYINPEHAPSLCERAEVYLQQSKVQWAETFFTRALRADPKYALAELGLAKLAKLRKDNAKYREHLENARRLDPDNEQIREEYNKAR